MKKYSTETIVGIFVAIGLICMGYMAVKLGKISLFGEETYVTLCEVYLCIGLENRQSH